MHTPEAQLMSEIKEPFPGLWEAMANYVPPTEAEMLAEGTDCSHRGEHNPNYRHGRRVSNTYDKDWYERNKHKAYYHKSTTPEKRAKMREYYYANKDKYKDADGRWSANVRAGTAAKT